MGLFGLGGLFLLSLWFTDRKKFYIYIGFLFVVIVFLTIILLRRKNHRFDKINNWHSGKNLIKNLQSMHPNDFEDYVADLYNRLGYSTEVVGGSHDGGIDVVAKKNGLKHYIQCKKFITSKVNVSEVRDFYGSMAGKLSNGKGIFITTNIFTTEAENFAEGKPIELIDGDKLLKLIIATKKDKEEIELKQKDKCPQCGGDLVEKNGKYGKFLGCSNYPKCKFIKNLK
jgi:restriction system protein